MPRSNARDAGAAADELPPRPYRILNCKPSPQQAQDWGFDAALKSGITETAIPASVDYRDDGNWPVGNQGQTGSCVGWATADAVLRWHLTQARLIPAWAHLSVRFIWMAAKETDEFTSAASTFIEQEGTSLKAALDVARNYGVVLDHVLPFDSASLYQDTEAAFYATASRLKIASYFNLGRNPNAWRRWLANNGPILTRLDVDEPWMDASRTGGRLERYDAGTSQGGHAVSVVGYDADGFHIRNSWGTDWGQNGYAYATNDYAQAAFTEAYGVNISGRAAVGGEALFGRAKHYAAALQPIDVAPEVAALATPSDLRRIEVSVDVQATRLARQAVSMGETVKDHFPTVGALEKLLGCVQDELADLKLDLIRPATGIKKKQLEKDYYALSRWIHDLPRMGN